MSMPFPAAGAEHRTPANGAPGAALPRVALIRLDAGARILAADPGFAALAGPVAPQPILGRRFAEAFPGLAGPGEVGIADDAPVAWHRDGTGWIGLAETGPRLDPLTRLRDRQALSRLVLPATSRPVIACIALDRFRGVNETLGHPAGDALLVKAAGRIVSAAGPEDTVFRLGGDVFAVLFGVGGPQTAEMATRRMLDLLSRPFIIEGRQVVVGASAGLAGGGCEGEAELPDAVELLRRADLAMGRIKRRGGGRIGWFDSEMLAALIERRALEGDLRKALLLDQFELAYQPQYDVRAGRITGFEALIRWRHPERGLISPASFIPLAEETRVILRIGAWVIEEACRSAARWPGVLTVAVNVSPLQFESDDFLASVEAALAASGLAAERLELELTETVLLSDDPEVAARMQALKARGVRLSLDDFGTGHSSFNYLRKYPFDKIKIDQSFVREPFADEGAHRIVAAVAGLGQAMGLTVIAEGVETAEQLARIRRQGCGAAQGYLLSRPMPGAEIAGWLAGPHLFDTSTSPSEGDRA